MKALAAALVALAVCLAGCASSVAPEPAAVAALPMAYAVGLDPSLSPDDVDGTLVALTQWSAAVGVTFQTSVSSCAAPDAPAICVYQGTQNAALDATGTMVTVSGPFGTCYTQGGRGGKIELHAASALLGPSFFHALITHEVGHALGLGHEDGDNVMNASIQDEPGPMTGDVAQFERVHSGAQVPDAQDNGI